MAQAELLHLLTLVDEGLPFPALMKKGGKFSSGLRCRPVMRLKARQHRPVAAEGSLARSKPKTRAPANVANGVSWEWRGFAKNIFQLGASDKFAFADQLGQLRLRLD